jgi:hypothetical protein
MKAFHALFNVTSPGLSRCSCQTFFIAPRERERNDWRLILTFMFKNCLNMFGCFVFGVFLDFVHIFHQPTPKHGTCCGENMGKWWSAGGLRGFIYSCTYTYLHMNWRIDAHKYRLFDANTGVPGPVTTRSANLILGGRIILSLTVRKIFIDFPWTEWWLKFLLLWTSLNIFERPSF